MDGCYDSLPGNARKRQKFLLRNVTFYIADEVRAIRTKYSVLFLIVALSFKICILNWFVKADKNLFDQFRHRPYISRFFKSRHFVTNFNFSLIWFNPRVSDEYGQRIRNIFLKSFPERKVLKALVCLSCVNTWWADKNGTFRKRWYYSITDIA